MNELKLNLYKESHKIYNSVVKEGERNCFMRKFFSIMLPILIMITVAIACIGIYLFGTNQINFGKKNLNIIQNSNNVVSTNDSSIVLSKQELPRLDASVITQPLMTSLVKDFTCDENISDSIFNYSDTDEAFEKLLNDEVDVLITTYPSDDILSLASVRGIELEVVPIAKEGFVFVVNKSNPIDSIKVSDIQKIYTGEIANWSQIGGSNLEIKAFQRPDNSITQTEMNNLVMKGLEMIEPPKEVFYDSTYGEINDLIADYDNSENGIGYSYYAEAKLLYDFDENVENAVKFLKVNDIEPNYENIKNSKYPIITNYYLIYNKKNQSEKLKIFVDAVLSERGKNAIKEAGYIDE